MLSLIFICLSSHYQFFLLPHYKLVSSRASIEYVQTISNDIAQASRLVAPLISHVLLFSQMKEIVAAWKINSLFNLLGNYLIISQ
jgi:hypothetical protein